VVEAAEARELLASARVACLGSRGGEGRPHLVPMTFAVEGDSILTIVDHKPKRTRRLRRLENIAADPRVSVLADHYDEDWSTLWWTRADGLARILEPGSGGHANAVARLAARYPQYREVEPDGPAIEISVSRWSGWRARP